MSLLIVFLLAAATPSMNLSAAPPTGSGLGVDFPCNQFAAGRPVDDRRGSARSSSREFRASKLGGRRHHQTHVPPPPLPRLWR